MKDLFILVRRGVQLRCPRCGVGKLYGRWNVLVERCPQCGCEIDRRGGDTWFATYMSTAFLTGLIVLWMFLFPMSDHVTGEVIVIAAWFALIVRSLPYRKALAIGFDYWIESKLEG